MEYEDGLPLSELLRRREASGRPFDEADLLAVMVPLLDGLQRVHEVGMLHRDIKPSNILVRRSDERPVLIDFGAAKQMAAEHSKSLAPYTEGYAAWEQVGEGTLGPWTDLYAVGAVMWRIVAGSNLPWAPPHPLKVEKRANAALRGEADPMPSARKLGAGRFSAGVLDAIDRCLKLNEQERVRGGGELLGLLRGEDEPVLPAAPQARRTRRLRAVPVAAGMRFRNWIRGCGELLGLPQSASAVEQAPAVAVSTAAEQVWSGARRQSVPAATGARFRDSAEGPEMVVIPAGSFLMGSPESEEDRDDNEGPQHMVTIPRVFAAGVYAVTRDEFAAFVEETGHFGHHDWHSGAGFGFMRSEPLHWQNPEYAQTGRDPVVCVNWKDAQAYVKWLSRKTGEEYRLLSEAEWEYAARAGTTTRYSFGDEVTPDLANYRESGRRKTVPVGSYEPNKFGLYDMHGNVWEWVQDDWGAGGDRAVFRWHNNYKGAPADGSAWEVSIPSDPKERVLRGGSWYDFSGKLSAASRGSYMSGSSNEYGFRVARTLKP